MKIKTTVHYIANVAIMLGIVALLVGVFYKVFILEWFGFTGLSFLRFGNTCLLLGIALSIRELIPMKKD